MMTGNLAEESLLVKLANTPDTSAQVISKIEFFLFPKLYSGKFLKLFTH